LDVEKILSEVSERKTLKFKEEGKSVYKRIRSDKQKRRHVFGGLERCDYTKGLIERLGIFSHVVSKLRNSNHDARFYQVTAPSRSENADYQNLDTALQEEVIKMNRQLTGAPIIHIDHGIPAPENYRFMKEVEVMLVTPLEDGMNLVAFEYILSQKYKKPHERGLLVLGTSGASRVLRERGFDEEDGIVYVNPLKAKDAAERTVEALKKGRHLSERLIAYVETERRVEDWAEKNIDAILSCRKGR
jgi:trehalose-6-phosphate synthase